MHEDDYILLSDIHNYSVCPRRFALRAIENQSNQNWRTIDGQNMHKNAHSGKCEKRNEVIIMRGLRVVSHNLCAYGQCDVVEFYKTKQKDGTILKDYDGLYTPYLVEYKRGLPPKSDCDKLQLCAQAICLEEMLLCKIRCGALFYGQNNKRVELQFDTTIKQQVFTLAKDIHKIIKLQHTPKPVATAFCDQCSLVNECLPILQKKQSVKAYINKHLKED